MSLKWAGQRPDTQNLPGLNWCFEPFERQNTMISKPELTAHESLRCWVNDQLIGFCYPLKASGKIGGFVES